MRKLGFWSALVGVVAIAATFAAAAVAATTVLVTQNTTSWTQDDTRGGGTVTWTGAYGAPSGLGSSSLQLATTLSTADKAGLYTHTMAGTPLADVTNLSYWTYQPAGNAPFAEASYQLQILDGCGHFTTLVFEPYENTAQGPIVPSTWQQWDVSGG